MSCATCARSRSPAWRRSSPGCSPDSCRRCRPVAQSLAPSLKAGVREGTYQRSRTRTVLLVLQGALSVVLLVGAGLFVRSLHNVRSLRLGYDVDPVLLRLPEPARAAAAADRARAARATPRRGGAGDPGGRDARRAASASRSGARRARASSCRASTPSAGSAGSRSRWRPPTTSRRWARASCAGAGSPKPIAPTAPLVAVVSEGMADAVWPGKDADRQCIMLDSRSRTVPHGRRHRREHPAEQPHRDGRSCSTTSRSSRCGRRRRSLFVRTRGDASAPRRGGAAASCSS